MTSRKTVSTIVSTNLSMNPIATVSWSKIGWDAAMNDLGAETLSANCCVSDWHCMIDATIHQRPYLTPHRLTQLLLPGLPVGHLVLPH